MACEKSELIEKLFQIKAIKFGDFTLKSGLQSPVYVDLRVIVSYPEIMRQISAMLWKTATDSKAEFSVICGVPYTALPIASCISVTEQIPMVMRRKEAKAYGTKRLIEGVFEAGSKCLVIEDVVTSGSSVMETVDALSSVDLHVTDAVVLLDRFQGGKEMLKSQGVNLHSLLTLTEVIEVLCDKGKVDSGMAGKVCKFLNENKFQPSCERPEELKKPGCKLGFEERSKVASHPLTKRLFQIISKKKSNLAVSVDFTNSKEVLSLVEKVGPHVCIVKTHVDILEDFTPEFYQSLQNLAEKYNFIVFEDRKFADIGNTVKKQYSKGLYHIANWADIVNAHAVPGDGVVKGLKEIGAPLGRACLLIAEMSSAGNLASGEYTAQVVEMAKKHNDFVIGFISQSSLLDDPGFVHLTPGVQLSTGGDALGQQYLTPADVIVKKGSDIIIVGRGIYQAEDPLKAAIEFKQAAYNAYIQRTEN